MSRNGRSIQRRPNPLSDLVAEKKRSAEIARARQQAEQLSADLPGIISERVGEHIQKLETKLLKDFQQMGQRAIEESTNVLNEALGDRIDTLEQISAIQSRTITNLRDSSKVADQKVSSVVSSIERTLSEAVPGFRLEPAAFASPQIPARGSVASTLHPDAPASSLAQGSVEIVKAPPQDLDEVKVGRHGFCPKCTSTHVRRANRTGIWEEFLRLFFIAPFRCRACRHKFYRF